MNRLPDRALTIEFEAGVLSPLEGEPVHPRRYRIGWLIACVDVERDRLRYRCFHAARALAPAFESSYFTDADELQGAVAGLDAIIVVGQLDRSVVELVALARRRGVPIFIDMEDDPAAAWPGNEDGLGLMGFLAVAPFVAGFTVPTADLAEIIEALAVDHGLRAAPVHVVPDIAETWAAYRATAEFVTGTQSPGELDVPEPKESVDRRQVLWIGDYGADDSSSGMFSLKPHLKALRSLNREMALELVIVGDSEAIYQALTEDCGFPTRYVPWSVHSAYSELFRSDVALLTGSQDRSGAAGSSHRILQALAAGVPVITSKTGSNAEFQETLFLGRKVDALRQCLGPSRPRTVLPRIEAAQSILDRYSLERLGTLWLTLLGSAIAPSRTAHRPDSPGKVLILLEAGDTPATIANLVAAANKVRNLDYDLLVDRELIEASPETGAALRAAASIPRFFSGMLAGAADLLSRYSGLVVERSSAPVAIRLASFASERGVPLVSSHQAINGGLNRFARSERAAAPAPSGIRAGPYKERLNPDGTVDWAFVVDRKARGWILDAICREIGSRQPASWQVIYHPEPSPTANNVFFSHYALLQKYNAERKLEDLNRSRTFVWYTHPREEDPIQVASLLLAFEKVTKVIFACESNRQIWLQRGLAEDKTAVVLGAADPQLFRYHERGGGVVGLSSSFYERKNPDCLLELVKLLPHRNFTLLGRKWNQYARFEEMRALPNFTYKSAPYREYGDIYATFDVFLSMSTLEGGPIPLVEAMMSNAVPVASRTGFAPDLIRHGENGFIFDLEAPAEDIAEMIEAAFALPGNVRETVERYSWDNFSAAIVSMAND